MPRGGGKRWHKYDTGNNRKTPVRFANLLDAGFDREKYEANPLTGDRLYSDQEREFLAAAEAYRQRESKKFLTATDYLRVLLSLGYKKG